MLSWILSNQLSENYHGFIVIKRNKFQTVNTHKFKQVVTELINIKHEYEPLMCTHEFEIKHASNTCLSSKHNLKQRQFRMESQKRPTISWFHFNFVKESM